MLKTEVTHRDEQESPMHDPVNTATVEIGDRVVGTYAGTVVAGTVSLIRQHTIRHDVTMIHMALDRPTELQGLGRTANRVVIHCSAAGHPVEGFVSGTVVQVVAREVAR